MSKKQGRGNKGRPRSPSPLQPGPGVEAGGWGVVSQILGLKNWFHPFLNPRSPQALHAAPLPQNPTYPKNCKELLVLSPWASTSAPAAVMWLFPSLEGKTEERLRQRAGQEDPYCPPRPGSGEWGAQGVWPRRRNRDQSSSSSWRRGVCCCSSGGSLMLLRLHFPPAKGEAWKGLFCKAV